MMKRALAALAVFLLIAAGAAHYLFKNMNPIARHGVEKALTDAFGSKVTVGDAQVDRAAGTIALKNIAVENPAGYAPGPALTIETAQVKLDLASFMSARGRIESIHASGCAMNVQMKDDRTNIEVLGDHARQFPEGGMTASRYVEIAELTIDPPRMNVAFPSLDGETLQFEQQGLVMHHIGGATSEQAGATSVPGPGLPTSVAGAAGSVFENLLAKGKAAAAAQLPEKLAQLKSAAGGAAKNAAVTAEALRKELGAKAEAGAAEIKESAAALRGENAAPEQPAPIAAPTPAQSPAPPR